MEKSDTAKTYKITEEAVRMTQMLDILTESPKETIQKLRKYASMPSANSPSEYIEELWTDLARIIMPEINPARVYGLASKIRDIGYLQENLNRKNPKLYGQLTEILNACPDDSDDEKKEYAKYGILIRGNFEERLIRIATETYRIPEILLNPWYRPIHRVIFHDHIETLDNLEHMLHKNPEHIIPPHAAPINVYDMLRFIEEDNMEEPEMLSPEIVSKKLWFTAPDCTYRVKWEIPGIIRLLDYMDTHFPTDIQYRETWLKVIDHMEDISETVNSVEKWNETSYEIQTVICEKINEKAKLLRKETP